MRDKIGLYPLNPEASKNPLAPMDRGGLNALNVATRAGPPGQIIDVGAPKQIGGKGGFLDRVTGGGLTKDGKKKSFVDRLLGEKVENQAGGIGQMIRDVSILRSVLLFLSFYPSRGVGGDGL